MHVELTLAATHHYGDAGASGAFGHHSRRRNRASSVGPQHWNWTRTRQWLCQDWEGGAPLGVEMNFYRAVPGRVKDCTRIQELGSRRTPRGTEMPPAMSCIGGPTDDTNPARNAGGPRKPAERRWLMHTRTWHRKRFAISVRSGFPSSARPSDAQIAERRAL